MNVEGTRRMLEFARGCHRLERFSYVSTAYVAGEPGGLFREDELAVGQRFRNPYERSKFEAELALRSEGRDLPLQILRPSIVVGDSSTGRTSSFNVLYGPLKAFARGAVPAIPARRDAPVDIVPVDYVADRVHELATHGPNGTFHLVAGPQRDDGRAAARDVLRGARPRRADRAVAAAVPALGASVAAAEVPRAAPDGGLLPVLRDARALRRPAPWARSARGGLLPPARALRPGSGVGAEVGPTLVCVIEKLVEQIEGRFAELSEQMSDPEVISDQRRYAEVGRAYRALERATGWLRSGGARRTTRRALAS